MSTIDIAGRLGPYEVMVSDKHGASEEDFESIASEDGLEGDGVIELDEPTGGRYWLLWITELPDGTGTASIAEVAFRGE